MRIWSLSTTIRSPQRLLLFLRAFDEVNNGDCNWDEHRKRRMYAHLVCARIIRPNTKGLPILLQTKLRNSNYSLTVDDAWKILDCRSSHSVEPFIGGILSHLQRWGMIEEIPGCQVRHNKGKAFQITAEGQDLLWGTLSLEKYMMKRLIYWKFPTDREYRIGNVPHSPIRPYVATLALVMEVNRLCMNQGIPAVGIWRDEFDLCALTLLDSDKVQEHAQSVLIYRNTVSENPRKSEAEKDRDYNYIANCLQRDGRAGMMQAPEYTDVLFRYFSLSHYFMLMNGGERIDINMEYEDEIKTVIRLFLHK